MFKSLKTKITVPMFGLLVLVTVFNIVQVSAFMERLGYDLAEERLLGSYRAARAHLLEFEAYSRIVSRALAGNALIIEYVGAGDRLGLMQHLIMQKEMLNVDTFVVTDALGYVMLRTHEPYRYGDSGAGFPAIAAAIHRGEVTSVYTVSPVVAMSLSSAAPIYDADGGLLGSIVSNISMDTDEFVDGFAKIFNAEVTVFTAAGRVAATTILDWEGDGQRTVGRYAAPHVIDRVYREGQEFRTMLPLYGVPHHAFYWPLFGFVDEPVGMFFVGFSSEYAAAATSSARRGMIMTSTAGLLLFAALMLRLVSGVVKPLKLLEAGAMKVVDGDIDVDFQIDRNDEIGSVSRAFLKLIASLSAMYSEFQELGKENGGGSPQGHALQGIFGEMMAQVRGSYEMSRIMLDAAPIAVFLYNKDLLAADCNTKAVEVFGFASREEARKNFEKTLPPTQPDGVGSKERLHELLYQAFWYGTVTSELMLQKTDGTPVPAEVTHVRVWYDGDYAVAEYARDLSDIKAIEEMAREANELNQLILDAAPMFMEIWNADVELIYCNRATSEWFELSGTDEFMGRYFEFAPAYQPCGTPSVEKVRRMIEQAMRDGQSKFEWHHITAKGEDLFVETTFVRAAYMGEQVVLGYNHDLRETKKTMAEMRRRESAEEESRAKTQFLARMSHEIRTPMNSVLGITELQLQKTGHPPETEEALLRIYNSSRLLLAIINDILDLSKVEAGKMEIIPVTYETASFIVDTVQLNLMHKGSKEIDFRLCVDEELPAYLVGDELRIKQVLNNLLSNAFKYTDEGSVTLSVGMEAHGGAEQVRDLSYGFPDRRSGSERRTKPKPFGGADRRSGLERRKDWQAGDDADVLWVTFRVEDTGQGMSQEQVDRLFNEEFVRFNLQSNRGIQGAGLGMAIAHHLVSMMGGQIQVQSEMDKGTVFTVRLPQKRDGSMVLGRESVDNLQNLGNAHQYAKYVTGFVREPMPYGRVLVVDDVESNLYVAKELLLAYKIVAETAMSGLEAIGRIKAGEVYDIIFMDHMMPEMDGIETVKIIRGMGYAEPIVALTANTIKGMADLFAENGFSGFVSKPIDTRQLNAYLVRFIRAKQPPEVLEAVRSQVQPPKKRDLAAMLNEAFVRDAGKAIGALEAIAASAEKGWDEDALKGLCLQAHGMKSALANIGEAELSEVAADLETAGKAGAAGEIDALLPGFLRSLRELAGRLKGGGADGVGEAPEEDTRFLREQFEAIREACDSYDIDAANAALDAIGRQSLSKGTEKLAGEISVQLLRGGFDEAAALARQYAGQ